MRLPDAIAPYASLLKVALLVLLLVGARVEGCVAGKAKGKDKIAMLEYQIDSLNASLTGFIGLYDRTTAQTKANAEAAEKLQDLGVDLAVRAVKERNEATKEAAKLDAELTAERSGCVDGNRPVCGIPLR